MLCVMYLSPSITETVGILTCDVRRILDGSDDVAD